MARQRREFAKEYKLEAVRLLRDSGKSLAEISRDLDIDRKVLSRWRDELQADPGNAFRGNGVRTEQQEQVWRLEREVETLRREREILKKVLGIISQP